MHGQRLAGGLFVELDSCWWRYCPAPAHRLRSIHLRSLDAMQSQCLLHRCWDRAAIAARSHGVVPCMVGRGIGGGRRWTRLALHDELHFNVACTARRRWLDVRLRGQLGWQHAVGAGVAEVDADAQPGWGILCTVQ
ncbi:hypothetical protein MRB53_039706 [Persea americana]|nr:hypothetical protein MRB53_039706 [Persea americana]